MPAKCVIKGCGSRLGKTSLNPGVSLHRFPKDPDLQSTWIEFVNLQNQQKYTYNKNHRLCRLHFDDDAYIDGDLRFKAVPTVFRTRYETSDDGWCNKPEVVYRPLVPVQMSDVSDQETRKNNGDNGGQAIITTEENQSPEPPAHCSSPAGSCIEEVVDDPGTPQLERPSSSTENASVTASSTQGHKVNFYSPGEVASRMRETGSKRCIQDFSEDDFSTPRKRARNLKKIQDMAQNMSKKLKCSRKLATRWKQRSCSLKDVMKKLRDEKLITEDVQKIIENYFPGDMAEVLRRVVDQSETTFNPTLRQFAMTLNFLSPAAYRYVREKMWKCLPHEKTIYRWLSALNGQPGFLEEAGAAVKAKVEEAEEKGQVLYAGLVVDDIYIRKGLEKVGDRIVGHVSHCSDDHSDDRPLATLAFFMMLVCLNGSWKIPIGYFLIHSATSIERANLVSECLTFCHSTGIVVKTLTFDGTASNLSMADALGAQVSHMNNLRTSFPHPVTKERVYVVLDGAHMIKLWRNTLGAHDLTDGDGQPVSFRYIEELHKYQEQEGILVAPKLKKRHIKYESEKMVVSVAAQTISESVADALLFLRTSMLLSLLQFEGSEGTERYCRVGNALWDIFNSKNFLGRGFKTPVQPSTWQKILDFFENTALPYLKSLRIGKSLILESRQKTGYLGFLVNIDTLKGLYGDLITTRLLKFLLTYKLSQDHLEIFFGHLRSFGGCNNNPSVTQLIASLKRILVQVQLGGRRGANAWPMDCTTVLHVSSHRPRKQKEDLNEDFDDVAIRDHDYSKPLIDLTSLTSYVKEVCTYIAGYVSMKVSKCVNCPDCIASLFSDSTTSELIRIKSKGGLKFPSADVVFVCQATETVLRTAKVSREMFTKDLLQHQLMVFRNLPSGVFSCLTEHTFNQNPLDNHRMDLIKLIIKKYLVCRVCSEILKFNQQQHTKKIRHELCKLTLFKNQ